MTLDQRVKALLAQLSKLSEAGTQKLEREHKGKPGSSPPPGARPDQSGKPDPDDSLLVWFLYRLERASTDLDKLGLIAQTELRVQKRLDGKLARSQAGAFGSAMQETTQDRDRRIAEDYEGLHPREVAAVESERASWCPEANVRKVRIRKGLDPDTGHESPRERADAERARELREGPNPLSIREIAMRMGKPPSTVQYWLEKKPNGKAA